MKNATPRTHANDRIINYLINILVKVNYEQKINL